MDINVYNEGVCRAIRDKYIECSGQYSKIIDEIVTISPRLDRIRRGEETASYKEYIDMNDKLNRLYDERDEMAIRRDTWGEAREICLDMAEELAREE